LKLINTTAYSTRDLKKLFTRIAKDELDPAKRKRVVFKVVYSKKGRISGCAYVGGINGTMRLPKPPYPLNMASLAMVIAHEMAHLRGMRHNQMRGMSGYTWRGNKYKTIYAWADEHNISIKDAPKPKRKSRAPQQPFRQFDKVIDSIEREDGDWWIYLLPGWSYDGGHQIHEDTVEACLSALQSLDRCDCEDCHA
jgi:predicted SprT family Zn-dependent metalloprotease